MNRHFPLACLLLFSLLLCGCLTPVRNEVPLASSGLAIPAIRSTDTKLVIFNDSNRGMYGIDGSGLINVTIDGKGVAQLGIGRYAQLIVPKGRHLIELVHWDVKMFRSTHHLDLTEAESFLKINATIFSNKATLVSKLPNSFETKFRPVRW